MQCKFFLYSDGHNLLETTGKLSDLERGFIFSRMGQIERYFDIYIAINMYDESEIYGLQKACQTPLPPHIAVKPVCCVIDGFS